MTEGDCIDWEDAFANAPYIEGGTSFPGKWTLQAEAFRRQEPCELDISYGGSIRERFDLFRPHGAAKGLAVFVHGGFWLNFDKSSWSHLAGGALGLGWAVAIPSYPLAPEAGIREITRSIARSIDKAAELVEGPIRLAGHSAGGHLVSRMVCEDSPLVDTTLKRIERVVSISGLHDLRPLMYHSMNQRLNVEAMEATEESAALRSPKQAIEFVAWVGARERPEFLRQSALIVEAWGSKGLNTELVVERGRHHFDVIDGLADAMHPLANAFAGALA